MVLEDVFYFYSCALHLGRKYTIIDTRGFRYVKAMVCSCCFTLFFFFEVQLSEYSKPSLRPGELEEDRLMQVKIKIERIVGIVIALLCTFIIDETGS